MMFIRPMAAIVSVALLAACVTPAGPEGGMVAITTMATSIAAADAAVATGQPDKAYAVLKHASQAFPTDKAPWVRMAQIHFEANNYGEAILDALKALERDPDDTLAYSIVAVSGLRVSSKALAQLTRKNNVNGDVKTEAQELVKLLRSSLGEKVLVPTVGPKLRAMTGKATTAASSSKSSSTSNAPLGAIE